MANFYEMKSVRTLTKIVIPKIQRDYAQGRNDPKVDAIRESLLNGIFDKEKTIDFGFVFGATRADGSFIPLDGQQRLTTLFLLDWYKRNVCEGDKNANLEIELSYETRRAARDFCSFLMGFSKAGPKVNVSAEQSVSGALIDSTAFLDYWKADPTVSGMLVMLDAIHEKFQKTPPNLENITFQIFSLNQFSPSRTDEMYLKMNSRGLPLTAFETTKALIRGKV